MKIFYIVIYFHFKWNELTVLSFNLPRYARIRMLILRFGSMYHRWRGNEVSLDTVPMKSTNKRTYYHKLLVFVNNDVCIKSKWCSWTSLWDIYPVKISHHITGNLLKQSHFLKAPDWFDFKYVFLAYYGVHSLDILATL